MNKKVDWWKMTKRSVEKSMTINIEKMCNEEKLKVYKIEVEAQIKIEELNMQDTNKKWDVMVNICINAAKKILGERLKSNINKYENKEIVKLSEKQ